MTAGIIDLYGEIHNFNSEIKMAPRSHFQVCWEIRPFLPHSYQALTAIRKLSSFAAFSFFA